MKKDLKVIGGEKPWLQQKKILSNTLIDLYRNREGELSILEAGCGKKWHLDLGGLNYALTGVDVSEDALRIRQCEQGDLDHVVIGDLSEINLKHDSYDLVYSSYVLEHIKNSEKVLDKMFCWLKKNGYLVLLIPDRDSFSGFIARFTPMWFHLFFYKHIRKFPDAGKPGHGPFPTFYERIISRKGILDYCSSHGYTIHLEVGKKGIGRTVFGAFDPIIKVVGKLICCFSLGRLSFEHVDLIYIIEKS